jgi:catechol 2,3-dioxygenase-like lactoylglutathione lyase family enzyme
MIIGAHIVFYSKDPEADRAFFRDVLEFRPVDAGDGWLIFALPPAEAAFHPANRTDLGTEFYLMCDDLKSVIKSLEAKKVSCAPISEERWGLRTSIRLPSGGEIGLYQPTHPTALG